MAKTPLPLLMGAAAPLRDRVHLPSALKYPDFRNYWLGLLAGVSGYQMLVLFSLGWLIFDLTDGDARWVGYMSVSIAGPAIILNLFGGVFADKFNPKHVLGLSQFIMAVLVAGLAMLVIVGVVTEWHVLAVAFLIGTVQAFDTPSRQSIFPRLIERHALPNAVALNAVVWTGTRIVAPTVAGIIIGQISIAAAIFVSALGFLVLSLVSRTLKLPPVERASGAVLKEMMTGFLFIKGNPIFSFLIGMTFFNSMFGLSYLFLMPVIAKEVLQVGPEKIAWLLGASGLGALAGIYIASNLGKFQHKGWLLIGGAVLFGASLILFATVSYLKMYELSLVILFLEGVFNAIYLMSVMTTLHALVPDQFRGRVMGFYSITWSMAPLGGLQANFMAHYINAPRRRGDWRSPGGCLRIGGSPWQPARPRPGHFGWKVVNHPVRNYPPTVLECKGTFCEFCR